MNVKRSLLMGLFLLSILLIAWHIEVFLSYLAYSTRSIVIFISFMAVITLFAVVVWKGKNGG